MAHSTRPFWKGTSPAVRPGDVPRRDTGGHSSTTAKVSKINKEKNILSQSDNLDVDTLSPPPYFSCWKKQNPLLNTAM